MTKISEVAKLLGISRQTVYIKINKLNLQQYLTITDSGKALSDEGVEKIRASLNLSHDSNPIVNQVTDNLHIDRLVDALSSQVTDLKKVIEEKDKQINQLHILLGQNNQLLLENKEQKKKWFWRK
jgi:predicted RNase H-like nuclease (RuvC/YqgF family)